MVSRWWRVWTSGKEGGSHFQKFDHRIARGKRSVFVLLLVSFGVGKEVRVEWVGVLLRLHHIMIDDTASGNTAEEWSVIMAATTDKVEGHLRARGNLTFCSWNVNGISEPVKWGKVPSHLRELQADVIFLQETHLKNEAHGKITAKWISQVYHSRFSAKARGVVIIIRKNVPFLHKSTVADKEGRYILVTGEIQNIPIVLLNIYEPNWDDQEFFRKTFSLIPDISSTNLIIEGDFNLVPDAYLDKSSAQRMAPSNASHF